MTNALLLILAGLLAGAGGAAEAEPLARARALLAAGQAREALPLVDAALARDPASAAAYLVRGQIKIELKDWPGSEADLQKGFDASSDQRRRALAARLPLRLEPLRRRVC